LALLWERRGGVPGAFPVLAVHDEIVVECAEDQAVAAAAWLKRAMVDALAALLEPVPVEVEVKVGRTWGGDFPAPREGSAAGSSCPPLFIRLAR
jgi:DNA polymerase-1